MQKNTSPLVWTPIGIVSMALFIGGARLAAGASASDHDNAEDARESLLETDREMSKVFHDREAFAEFLAPDIWNLVPDAPRMQGRDAFLDASAAFVEMDLEFGPDEAMVSAAGDFGISIGTFHLTVPDANGEPVRRKGTYQSTWRRADGGRWQMIADMYNFDAPMP